MADLLEDESFTGEYVIKVNPSLVYDFDEPESSPGDEGDSNEAEDDSQEISLVLHLKELSESDIIHSRQEAVRKLLEVLTKVAHDKTELHGVVSIICSLSDDNEGVIRAELVEQMPALAKFCRTYGPDLEFLIRQQLVPITVKLTEDEQLQVRKTSRLALLTLFQLDLVEYTLSNDWICPFVAMQTSLDVDAERRSEATELMCNLAPLVGRAVTETCFLEKFTTLTTEPSFLVRRACALNFGKFCKIVGRESTEELLLCKFFALCEDERWDIRKCCAEAFADVSSVLSSSVRMSVLPSKYVCLLKDFNIRVSYCAYENLGKFMYSYAEPAVTGLTCDEENEIYVVDQKKLDSIEAAIASPYKASVPHEKQAHERLKRAYGKWHSLLQSNDHPVETERCNGESLSAPELSFWSRTKYVFKHILDASSLRVSDKVMENCESSALGEKGLPLEIQDFSAVENSPDDGYNNFQYWRVPLPDVEIEFEREGESNATLCTAMSAEGRPSFSLVPKALPPKLNQYSWELLQEPIKSKRLPLLKRMPAEHSPTVSFKRSLLTNTVHISPFSSENTFNKLPQVFAKVSENEPWIANIDVHLSDYSTFTANNVKPLLPQDQNIVPPEILEEFIRMADSKVQNEIDQFDKPKCCAASLPAVALTIGRMNWGCLVKTFHCLATHAQWQVRKVVASSLDVLSCILGETLSTYELVPVCISYLQDMNRVRDAVLENLLFLIRNIKMSEFSQVVGEIINFLHPDETWSWRSRYMLARQLEVMHIMSLIYGYSNKDSVIHIALLLLNDKVSKVREAAISLFALIVMTLGDSVLQLSPLLEKLQTDFALSPKWRCRQTFVQYCEFAVSEGLPHPEWFSTHLAVPLLELSRDSVPNVRLCVARCLSEKLSDKYFIAMKKQHSALLESTMTDLLFDADRDVRHFSRIAFKRIEGEFSTTDDED